MAKDNSAADMFKAGIKAAANKQFVYRPPTFTAEEAAENDKWMAEFSKEFTIEPIVFISEVNKDKE